MTDDDVLTAVHDCLTTARDRVAGEQMTRPTGAVINRARRRRLHQGLTAAAAVIVMAAAFTLPGSGDLGATQVRLAAWTVLDKPGGLVNVTIRELRDPAGLERRLRADRVPATIRFASQFPPHHRPCFYPLAPSRAFRLLSRIFPRSTSASGHIAFTINPSAIPTRIGLWINVSPPARHGTGSAEFSANWSLVYASSRCPSGKVTTISGAGVVGGSSK